MPRVRRGTARVLVLTLTCSGLTGAAAVLTPGPALAAGTVLFNQPFHNNTRRGPAPSSCRRCRAGPRDEHRLPDRRRQPGTGALRSCTTRPDTPGQRQAAAHRTPTINRTGGLFGAASVPTSQGLDVTFNTYQYGGTGAGRRHGLRAGRGRPRQPASPATIGQPAGRWATPRSRQPCRPGQRLPRHRPRRLRQLQQQHLPGHRLHRTRRTSSHASGCRARSSSADPGDGRSATARSTAPPPRRASPALALRAATRAARRAGRGGHQPDRLGLHHRLRPGGPGRAVQGGSPRWAERRGPWRARCPRFAAGLYPSPTWLNANGIPRQLAFGWVGSTGSVTDFHEVDNAKVVTFNPVPDLNVAQTSYNGPTPQPGDPVNYTVVAGVDAGANETAPISVTQTLPAGWCRWARSAPAGSARRRRADRHLHQQQRPVRRRDLPAADHRGGASSPAPASRRR